MASLLQSDTQLNQHSYYEASVLRPAPLPALQTDVMADVVVVGVENKQQEERAIMMVDVPQGAEEVANKLLAAAKSKKRKKGGLAAPMEL